MVEDDSSLSLHSCACCGTSAQANKYVESFKKHCKVAQGLKLGCMLLMLAWGMRLNTANLDFDD